MVKNDAESHLTYGRDHAMRQVVILKDERVEKKEAFDIGEPLPFGLSNIFFSMPSLEEQEGKAGVTSRLLDIPGS
jgi:hypothetical protein